MHFPRNSSPPPRIFENVPKISQIFDQRKISQIFALFECPVPNPRICKLLIIADIAAAENAPRTPQASDDERDPETQNSSSGSNEDCETEGEDENPQPPETSRSWSCRSTKFCSDYSCSAARLPGCEAEFAVGNAAGGGARVMQKTRWPFPATKSMARRNPSPASLAAGEKPLPSTERPATARSNLTAQPQESLLLGPGNDLRPRGQI